VAKNLSVVSTLDTPQSSSTPVGCAFGPFVVDFVRRLAWRDGRPLGLAGKSFEILTFLIAHRDRVVSKDELLKEVWPDTFVQENNLVRHVSTLRKALGQRPEEHDYVLTVQGRGYRFVAAVTELMALPAELAHGRATADVDASGPHATPDDGLSGADSRLGEHPSSVVPAHAAPGGEAHTRWWQPAIVLALAGLAVAVWVARGPSTPVVEARVVKPFTYGPSAQLTPAWSPDGQTLAYASDRDGNFDLYVQALGQPDPTRLTTSAEADWQPAWSPDRRWMAFRSERDGGGLYVMPASGGPERRLTTFGFEPRWSPDGRRILFSSSQFRRPRPRAFIVSVDGTDPKEVLTDVVAEMQAPAFGWHPDGRLSVSGLVGGVWRFVTVSLNGQGAVVSEEPQALATEREALDLILGRFVWAFDGRSVYFEGRSFGVRNLWRLAIDPRTLAWKGPPERLTAGQGVDRALAVSPDGRRLAFEAGAERTRIWAFPIDPDTGEAGSVGDPVTPGSAGEFDAAVSRDGLQLVYRTVRDRNQELWQHSFADGRERRLLSDPLATRSSPRWSPDGSSLVYLVSTRAEGSEAESALAILSATGGSERLLRAPGTSAIVPDDWSADGRSVLGACSSGVAGRSAVCLVSIDNPGSVRVIASDPERSLNNARFSPNQQHISFTAHRPGLRSSTVYVRPVDGGSPVPMTDGTAFEDKAHWAPDGRTLYFVSDRSGFLNVWGRRFDPATGQPAGPVFQVTRFDGLRQAFPGDLRSVDMAVTNDRLFVPLTEISGQVWVLEHLDR
jgi:Tol biopolymer transport system component/DNA-binding winged helix-turn-helix (wHTH) protein